MFCGSGKGAAVSLIGTWISKSWASYGDTNVTIRAFPRSRVSCTASTLSREEEIGTEVGIVFVSAPVPLKGLLRSMRTTHGQCKQTAHLFFGYSQ